jgi:hypothetical protein
MLVVLGGEAFGLALQCAMPCCGAEALHAYKVSAGAMHHGMEMPASESHCGSGAANNAKAGCSTSIEVAPAQVARSESQPFAIAMPVATAQTNSLLVVTPALFFALRPRPSGPRTVPLRT